MDVTTLLGGINIAATLGAGSLLWWGLSAKFDEVEHFLAAKYGDLPDRADRIKDRVAAERAAVSRRFEHLNVYLSHRHDDQQKYRGLTRPSGGRQVWTGGIHCDEASLDVPLRWRRPRLVFVNSMSDLFHADVPESFIARVWATMRATPRHTYQILTKRPDRMREVAERMDLLPNVWLGTSVESSEYLGRLRELRFTPAAVRFVSFEPLLGPITDADLSGVHWAIVGGESGPGSRRMKREWVRALQVQCAAQGVAFFFKQWGGSRKKRAGRELDGRTWDAMPSVPESPREQSSTSP